MNEMIFETTKALIGMLTSNLVTKSNISQRDAFEAISSMIEISDDQLYESFDSPELKKLLKDMAIIATFQFMEEARKRAIAQNN